MIGNKEPIQSLFTPVHNFESLHLGFDNDLSGFLQFLSALASRSSVRAAIFEVLTRHGICSAGLAPAVHSVMFVGFCMPGCWSLSTRSWLLQGTLCMRCMAFFFGVMNAHIV